MAKERQAPVSVLGLKLVYLYPWKDLVDEFKLNNRTPEDLKDYIRDRIETIDKTERRWIVVIAGLGFFADAYSIFSINMVLPMLGIVYYGSNHGIISPSHVMGIVIATLSGSLFGQLFFGICADILGRRRMYGWELVVTIFATIGVATASYGVNGSLSILGGLIAYRFILGLGIGADYPLSAVICSEFAPTENRARMLSAVFFFQPLGQLAATLVALVVTACFKNKLTAGFKSNSGESPFTDLFTYNCYQDQDCVRTVDIMWRIIIGLGAVPPVLALWFRLAILESPRYTADVLNENIEAYAQMHGMGTEVPWRRPSKAIPRLSVSNPLSTGYATGVAGADNRNMKARRSGEGLPVSPRTSLQSPAPNNVESTVSNDPIGSDTGPQSTYSGLGPDRGVPNGPLPDITVTDAEESSTLFNDIKHYYWDLGHGWTLFACCLCWFCVDFPFYGLGMNNPTYIGDIWSGTDAPETHLYKFLFGNAWQGLIIVSIGAVTGGLTAVISMKLLGERLIQMMGFFLLFILFIIIGSSFKTLMNDGRNSAIVVLYLLCQIFFNFGPNTTTYMIPAEFFPTRFRASSHGIAAASGKFGSVIAQIVVYFLSNHFGASSTPGVNYIQTWLGYLLICFSPFMLLGLIATIYLIPNIRGANKTPLTLEILAAEDQRVNNLMKRILRGRTDESLLPDGASRHSGEEPESLSSVTASERGDESGGSTRQRNEVEAEMRDPQDELERFQNDIVEGGGHGDAVRQHQRIRMERRYRTALDQSDGHGNGDLELDEISLGEPAQAGSLHV